MTLSTSTTISDRTNVYAEREMLKHAEPVMVLGKFGMHKKMPKNKTTTINFRRAVTLEAITTPLAEGVTPKTTAFRYDIVEGTLKQYGMVMGLTDVIEDQTRAALDGIVNDFRIEWVWMPPWGPDKITDDGREMLRALGFNVG